MKQTRISRKARAHGGQGEPVADLVLPTTPVRDTSAARTVLAHIDAALATR